jgi:hypothetical protein
MRGGRGSDTIDASDGGKDRVRGGRGSDTCIVNATDVVRGCEQKIVAA